MRNYKIHLIRHGMTELNESGKYAGCKSDCDLSQNGIRELIKLKEEYEYPNVGEIYTSPMARCVETAGILYPGRDFIAVPQFREIDFGDFTDKTFDELKDREDFKAWIQDAGHIAPPNGESGEQLLERVIDGFNWAINDMMKNGVFEAAFIMHGGVIMTLLSAVGLPKRAPGEWMMSNGRGYTCFTSAELWQRDGIVEVAGILPHGAETVLDAPAMTNFYKTK